MKKEVKEEQHTFKWGMNFVLMDMKKIFDDMHSQEEKIGMIQTHMKAVV